MDIQTLSLIVSSIHVVQSLIWLTINDKNVTDYTTSDNFTSPITFLCHQQTNWESAATWIYRTRAISKLNTTNPTSLGDPINNVWNDTFEWPDYGGPQIYVDQRRTTFASRWQKSQYYWATGYTIIAPTTSDSGVYRCRGVIAFGRTRIPEESTPVTLVVKQDAGPTTLMTINENEASVIEVSVDYVHKIRCHSFIPDTQATVLYHQVFKAQNLTRRSENGEVSFEMTDWQMVYEFNQSRYGNAASNQRVSNQDLTSGFNIESPGYSESGLYFCSAVYTIDKSLLKVNSSIVYLDARVIPFVQVMVLPTNDSTTDNSCWFENEDEEIVSCTHLKDGHYDAVCIVYSYHYIPEIDLVVDNVSSEGNQRIDYESADANQETGQFQTRFFDSIIKKTFFASDICRLPEVTCSAAVPGSPDRVRRRTMILLSRFCQYPDSQYLRSQGAIIDVVPSMIFVFLVALVLIPKFNVKLHEHGQL